MAVETLTKGLDRWGVFGFEDYFGQLYCVHWVKPLNVKM